MRQIVIDLETKDPELKTYGSDAHTRRFGGHVFMVGLRYLDNGNKIILPWNEKTKERLRREFDGGNEWIGANLKYDLGWLLSEGVLQAEHTFNNRFFDILIDAALLDETKHPSFYSLDGQSSHYGLPKKPIEKLLDNAAAKGIKCDAKTVRGLLHKLDSEVVAEYLDHDLMSTGDVFLLQRPLLAEEKLERVSELESRLLPVLALMEQQGVKVDLSAAQDLYDQCCEFIESVHAKLRAENGGYDVPLSASTDLTNFVLGRGHKLAETPASRKCRNHKTYECKECTDLGKPPKVRYSLSAPTLEALAKVDPILQDLIDARRAEKIAKDFVNGGIMKYAHNGRIHANINQIVSYDEGDDDSKGVRFGRLSYSKPNLQQIPKRDRLSLEGLGGLGSAMRRLFIAEEGYDLMSSDFSSQEPRWIIHWCETWNMPGAKRIGDMYREDPTISSHDIVASGIQGDIPYKRKRALAKVINLGKGYEMGYAKLVANLKAEGLDSSQAEKVMEDFERNFPHVGSGSKAAMYAAEKNGYVRTFYGRKLRFNDFEPVVKGAGPAMPYDQAYEYYTLKRRIPIRRAFCYRAFNRIVQGSSADQTKAAMVELWYTYRILATLQVHDELVDARSTPERARIFKHVMETVCPLTIPSLTEVKIGQNWKDGTVVSADFSSVVTKKEYKAA